MLLLILRHCVIRNMQHVFKCGNTKGSVFTGEIEFLIVMISNKLHTIWSLCTIQH